MYFEWKNLVCLLFLHKFLPSPQFLPFVSRSPSTIMFAMNSSIKFHLTEVIGTEGGNSSA